MNDGKNQVPGMGEPNKNRFFAKITDIAFFKDAALLLGWIAGLILLAGLVWALSQPVRNRLLIRAVNSVLEESGDHRKLGTLLSGMESGSLFMNSWYTMTGQPDGTKAVVFTFIGEGFFFPCSAVVSPGGKVAEFIPLGSYSKKMLQRVSPGIIGIYIRRIEGIK